MTSKRTIVGGAAFALALAGGGAAGALLGAPNISGAQDTTDDATEDTTAAPLEAGAPRPRFEHRGESLATAAEVVGLSEEELRARLEAGESIAQVAEAQGVDVQEVVDALVAQATARLEEVEAALPERITEMVNREGLGGQDHGPGGHHGMRLGLDAAASALGMDVDDLRAALAEGATLAEVAQAQGVDVQVLVEALVAEAEAHIDEAVADGRIDADRAAEMKAGLTERITERINSAGGDGPGAV
jgi:polyhydroxyalkanoate synthesis regulator phasin